MADKGDGYVPGEGPAGAPIAFVAESAGVVEALTGRPLVGDAGGMFTRLLNLLGWSRDAFRLDNCARCRPPGDWFDERAPWFHAALAHCQYVEHETLSKGSKVVVALGGTALRRLMHLEHHKGIRVENFHGAILRDPTDRFWVVPTFHPSFLQRGATNLIGTVLWDLRQAEIARDTGKPADNGTLIIDPPLDWFTAWVDQVVAARLQDPRAYPISSDIETPDKVGGKSEGELTSEDKSYQILRVNNACHPDEGVTVPFAEGYIDQLARLHQSPGDIWGWNCPTPDQRVLTADLRWVAAGDLCVGDEVVGFDDTPQRPSPLARRRYRTAVVTHAERRRAPVFGIRLSDGTYLKVTGEHRWYTQRKSVFRWTATRDLKVGQRLQRLYPTWAVGSSWQHGYLAGFFDGEGTLHVQKTTKTIRVAATQRIGPTLDRARELLRDLGMGRDPKFPSRAKDRHIGTIHIQGGMADIAHFLGEVRPPRLLAKFRPEQLGALQSWRRRDLRVEAVESLGEQEIIGLSTSTHTYVLEGFGSHNCEYDFPRLLRAGQFTEADNVKWVDLMWYAKVLQSDIPLGLGFWAPFYSTYGPWKHLASQEPAKYAAIDALQNHRIGFGLIADLIRMGQYRVARRHTHDLKTLVLRPAQLVGVKVDRQRLTIFKESLAQKARSSMGAIQLVVPESVCPLTPKGGLTKPPLDNVLHVKASAFTRKGRPRAGRQPTEIKQELYAHARVVEQLVLKEVWTCETCGAVDVPRRHRCALGGGVQPDPDGADRPGDVGAQLVLAVASVRRWFWQEPFNPDSWQQVLAYIKAKKHRPGRNKKSKSGSESTDRETLLRLSRTTDDAFYRHLLDYRAVVKVKGTYVEGTERRLDSDDRLHPVPTFRPSTMRLSYVDPNITNVVADKGGEEGLAAGFRRCIVADPAVPAWAAPAERAPGVMKGARLLEVDFSAIEGTQTGWCGRDPHLMRIARLGIHSYLIAQRMKDAPDLRAPDVEIAAHLKAIKKKAGALLYDQIKHTVYGVLYGQTPIGLQYTWPHLYPTQKSAQEMVDFMFAHFPSVKVFQQTVMDTAARQHFLGGPDAYTFTPPALGVAGGVVGHPYQYKHWFWSIYTYKRLTRVQELRLLALAQKAGQAAPITYINSQPFRLGRGSDANRAIALYPQSIAAGNLKEVELRLFADHDSPSYIGDAYFGRTPLRAPIHDSLLLEVPFRTWDRVAEKVGLEMQRPILEQPLPAAWGLGTHLTIGVAAKAGENWADCQDLSGTWGWTGAVEAEISPMEIEDEADVEDLQRAV